MDVGGPLTEARERLSEIIEHVAVSSDSYTITKHGKNVAVILGFDEYESLIETLNVLSDDDTMDALNEARAERSTSARE